MVLRMSMVVGHDLLAWFPKERLVPNPVSIISNLELKDASCAESVATMGRLV